MQCPVNLGAEARGGEGQTLRVEGTCRRGWPKLGGSQDCPGTLLWKENKTPGHTLAFPRESGGFQNSGRLGWGGLQRKDGQKGTPWMKVEPWKMGTSPNSRED